MVSVEIRFLTLELYGEINSPARLIIKDDEKDEIDDK